MSSALTTFLAIGSRANLEWLKPRGLRFYDADIRDFRRLSEVFTQNGEFDLVIHEAGQVAVTTSVTDPRNDFEINALGTFNVLEATRLFSPGLFLSLLPQTRYTEKCWTSRSSKGTVGMTMKESAPESMKRSLWIFTLRMDARKGPLTNT